MGSDTPLWWGSGVAAAGDRAALEDALGVGPPRPCHCSAVAMAAAAAKVHGEAQGSRWGAHLHGRVGRPQKLRLEAGAVAGESAGPGRM
jgi:hypothetical protein